MDTDLRNILIHEIAEMIIPNERYANSDWDALLLVVTVIPGNKELSGYIYEGETWEARGISLDISRAFFKKLLELQSLMKDKEGREWKQCLIHITRPDYEINIQLEYNDLRRWFLKKAALDMADYASSPCPLQGLAAVPATIAAVVSLPGMLGMDPSCLPAWSQTSSCIAGE